MKFSLKMTLSVTVLLALCLSLNGYALITASFNSSLGTIAAQNIERHYRDAALIERECALGVKENAEQWFSQPNAYIAAGDETPREAFERQGMGRMFTDRALQLAGKAVSETAPHGAGGMSIRLSNGSPVYTAMPEGITQNSQIDAVVNGADDSYSLIRTGERAYILLATPLIINYRDASLISAYEVTPLFSARDAQLKDLAIFTAATLLVGVALVALLSGVLTRPLARLQAASERIAGGNYSERTAIRSDDEIGALSGSFDRMARAVDDKIATLNENVREREDFVSAFTHELKTPMTSMLGYAALLRKGETEPEQRRAAADYIWRETKRLESLSQKLMLLMGLREEKIELQPVPIKALFNSLEKTLPKTQRGVEVRFRCESGVKALADKVLLDDLLRNLITNAQRACDAGGSVEVSCAVEGEKAVVCVEDDGRGIPADELARIVEPFYMVDKSRSRAENGSGMGLALCARIAELFGSGLEFQSEVGGGTRVRFALALPSEEAK